MSLINWDDSFSVKVAEIDSQHQNLVKLINELNDAMKEGKGKDILGGIINQLITYTATHFKTEENYFARFKYEDSSHHIEEHQNFVTKVTEFKEGFENGKMALSLQVMTFLKEWLTKHIKGSDQKYSKCFNENGLT